MILFAKERMIQRDLQSRGIQNPNVLQAMRSVPRENFVPESQCDRAYNNCALPLMLGQTISQPYIVALMTQMLQLEPNSCVLEIGSGSGYQAAVLAQIASQVHSIERIPELATYASSNLRHANIDNVHVHVADGWDGWPQAAPYDGIMVTAAAEHIPKPLLKQLRPGGRMMIPLGPTEGIQILIEVYKKPNGTIQQTERMGVRFVPLISSHN